MSAKKLLLTLTALVLAIVVINLIGFWFQTPLVDYDGLHVVETYVEGDLNFGPRFTELDAAGKGKTLSYRPVGKQMKAVKVNWDGTSYNEFFSLERRSDGIVLTVKQAGYYRTLFGRRLYETDRIFTQYEVSVN